MVNAQDQTQDERLAQSMADSIAMNKALKETIADKERLIERQNSQSEELQNELRSFNGKHNVVLINEIEDTEKKCKLLENECDALIITRSHADSVIAALNCELEPLRPFRESQLTERWNIRRIGLQHHFGTRYGGPSAGNGRVQTIPRQQYRV